MRSVPGLPDTVDAEGLDVVSGRRLAPRARLALVTPSRQFPLGMPLSLARRAALMAAVAELGSILESNQT
jgi:GntR family transcriptional regulator / MocR family aminotransferase